LRTPIIAAAAATLVAVTVHHGGARVQPNDRAASVELADGDRALLEDRLPPLVTRHRRTPTGTEPLVHDALLRESLDVSRRELQDRIEHCYDLGLDDKGILKRHLEARLRIVKHSDKGVVQSAELLDGNINAPLTDQCVLEAFGNMQFPLPKQDAVELTYPLDVSMRAPSDDDMQLLQPHF
jgi:hypothetical protein